MISYVKTKVTKKSSLKSANKMDRAIILAMFPVILQAIEQL